MIYGTLFVVDPKDSAFQDPPLSPLRVVGATLIFIVFISSFLFIWYLENKKQLSGKQITKITTPFFGAALIIGIATKLIDLGRDLNSPVVAIVGVILAFITLKGVFNMIKRVF